MWLGLSRFVLVDCGRRNFEQSRRSDGAWLGESLGSARVNGCTDTVRPLPPPLMCELFTETTDVLTSLRATSILPFPTTRNERTADEACRKTGRRNAA
ncbi:hypothetical protein AVEN_200262-1 [Araneus ventricosus]|uniref:Uncharacterized protein n=1 Tax=Araneus ventricosus TaxID=182803 RepID=A0A4Y2DT83_ARAVE|nr:hypothetical protein AVEN_200262-1 [Araneus ventricosus]